MRLGKYVESDHSKLCCSLAPTLSSAAGQGLMRFASVTPVLSTLISKTASARLRNLATIGGNAVQRVRCPYFRTEEPTPCNKRLPHLGCAALHGHDEKHAIFGWTEHYVAVQPSNPAVALDAVIVTEHMDGRRRILARDFHVLPNTKPTAHNVLRHGELITSIELGTPAPKSAYLKGREPESYEYATVFAAVAPDLDGEVVQSARVALGSLAMRPWRLDETERQLAGQRLNSPAVADAVAAGFADARALSGNAYRIPLARNAVLRALELAARAS